MGAVSIVRVFHGFSDHRDLCFGGYVSPWNRTDPSGIETGV